MADKNIDEIVSNLTRQPFKFDAQKYSRAKPRDRGYEYDIDNKRVIFDSDAFTDYVNKNSPGREPYEYSPSQYKFRVESGGKYKHFPTFDEAYNFAINEPIKNPFELSDKDISKDVRKWRSGSMSQEAESLMEHLSDTYGIDFDNLIYGEQGFHNSKYPQGLPEELRAGLYSDKYWDELDKWFKEGSGSSLADRKAYVEKKRRELYGI